MVRPDVSRLATWVRRPGVVAALAALLGAGLFWVQRLGFVTLPGVERLERYSLDNRFLRRGALAPDPDVALVFFDDRTAREAPRLFERRGGWAQLLRSLKDQGARTVALDAVFLEPQELLTPEIRERVAAAVDGGVSDAQLAGLLTDIHRELDGDAQLADALGSLDGAVLLMTLNPGKPAPDEDASLSRGRYGQATAVPGQDEAPSWVVASLPSFTRRARAMGSGGVADDETYSSRQLFMAQAHLGGFYLPMGAMAWARFHEINRGKLAFLGPSLTAKLGDLLVPTDSQGRVWLNHLGANVFPRYSAVDVVNGAIPQGALAGKAVFVGTSQVGEDLKVTPFSRRTPGVELHATLFDNLSQHRLLTRAGAGQDALLALLLGLIGAGLFVGPVGKRPLLQLSVFGLAATGLLALATVLFDRQHLWIAVVGPIANLVFVSVVGLLVAYLGEGRQRAKLRAAFAQYIGEDVISELTKHPDRLRLGGERRRLSVLFSDIRDFSSLSEKLDPETLVRLLNTYLTPMTRAVLGVGGLLDKYIGDAVMAVFGAPVARPDHARMALSCALKMHEELLKVQPAFTAENLTLAIGVGINTGDMVVGNMGSIERFDYTVTGDAVNLASRLEGLTKVYGAFCLVGPGTRSEAGEGYAFREVDLVQVKGKQEAVGLFELLSGPGHVLATYEELPVFEIAIAAYRAGRFGEARAAFEAFHARNPKDKVAKLYLERLADAGDAAPPGWTGVFTHTSK